MTRGLISDAARVNKWRDGWEEDCIPCIRCLHCLDYSRAPIFSCSVNPTVGRESRLPFFCEPVGEKKKVIIVGGGPAGMQAAIQCADRGHDVTIVERASELGGKLVFSKQVSFKSCLATFMNYLIHQVEKKGVHVLLNTEATPESIAAMNADVVLSAVGADAVVPHIPGADSKNVITAEQAYDLVRKGKNLGTVAVLGGGLVGCETALYLTLDEGYAGKVTLVEMTDTVAADEMHLTQEAMLERMDETMTYHTHATCTEITEQGLTYQDAEGELHQVAADTNDYCCKWRRGTAGLRPCPSPPAPGSGSRLATASRRPTCATRCAPATTLPTESEINPVRWELLQRFPPHVAKNRRTRYG